jgi:hypothetical protein
MIIRLGVLFTLSLFSCCDILDILRGGVRSNALFLLNMLKKIYNNLKKKYNNLKKKYNNFKKKYNNLKKKYNNWFEKNYPKIEPFIFYTFIVLLVYAGLQCLHQEVYYDVEDKEDFHYFLYNTIKDYFKKNYIWVFLNFLIIIYLYRDGICLYLEKIYQKFLELITNYVSSNLSNYIKSKVDHFIK